MRNLQYLILLLLVGGSISSCTLVGETDVEASGELITIEGDQMDFESVDISDAFSGVIELSDTFSSSVTIDENLEEHLVFRKIGSTLEIGLKNGVNFSGFPPRFIITMPELISYDGSGASKVMTEDFVHDGTTRLELSGASEFEGDIESPTIDLDISGASKVVISGLAQNVLADVTGASNAQLNNLETVNANVDLSGASSAYLNINGGELTGEASGASSLRYRGEPSSVSVSTSGASTVTQD